MKKHSLTREELQYRQNLPLEIKVPMTIQRIRDFSNWNDCYISFSGGKDSTVLLDIARKYDKNIEAVFCDTWLEYPQIRQFVKTFDNVTFIKPEKSMKEIINEYGWNFPSKDVAEAVWYARKGSQWAINKLNGLDKNGKPSEYRKMYKKWAKLIDAPFKISNKCCIEMKENPVKKYEKQTGKMPIIALMAEESARRKEAYLRTGCNTFDGARPMSKPMGFWTEQDVLQYIVKNNLRIAKPYGEIVPADNQYSFGFCGECKLKTTCESRTGCMFCPVGCHLDNFAKFERLKKYSPKLYDYCMEELNLKQLVEWVRKEYVNK